MKEPLIYGVERISYEEAVLRGYIESNSLGKMPDGSAKSTYDYITEKVIKLIESSDNLPWRKPWELNSLGEPQMPTNYANKSNYRGFNVFFLHWQMTFRGHSCPYFLTFKQVEAAKGRVKKGASAYNVIFYTNDLYRHITTKKTITKKVFDDLSVEQQSQYTPSWTLKGYNVFNAEEIEGIEFDELWKTTVLPDNRQIENCEAIIQNMPNRPKLGFGGDRAYYSPSGDNVQMPQIKFFKKEQEYYSTFYHELIHSTGYEQRLKRDFSGKFGSEKYAFEELIAEMGACYLCGESGILYYTIKNSGAYFQSWKKSVVQELREDNKAIFKAAAEAQRAADYILGLSDPEIYKKFSPQGPAERPSKPISETPTVNNATALKIKIRQRQAKAKLNLLNI